MAATRDPLANPKELIRRVYAYCAYRLGDGPDAEDATSDAFERALRYRKTYDPKKGTPAAWMMGIARRSVDDVRTARPLVTDTNSTWQPRSRRSTSETAS
jgi:DNA-directed RNA polymerase specialized sigma24 family protein